ncbi:MAG: response regulator [Oscillospiraceae bacterium]|nr:response regulator [Oscillospiraceae bacterium]
MSARYKKHVLVVDDNIILLRTVKDMLEDQYSVSISTSGYQALEMIKRKKPDIILLDYEMPEMNGAEVLQKLHSEEETRDIPVVFFTASARRETVTMLIKLNPSGYVLKPPNKQNLLNQIEKILNPTEE